MRKNCRRKPIKQQAQGGDGIVCNTRAPTIREVTCVPSHGTTLVFQSQRVTSANRLHTPGHPHSLATSGLLQAPLAKRRGEDLEVAPPHTHTPLRTQPTTPCVSSSSSLFCSSLSGSTKSANTCLT